MNKDKNFIIENGQGGILDNYMFGYQNDPAASKIFDPEHGFGPRGLSRVRKMKLPGGAIQHQATPDNPRSLTTVATF